jgi:hypothetical protein
MTMPSLDELHARVLDEVQDRGGMEAVLNAGAAPGECTATALFSIQDEFTEEQFRLVFALGQLGLISEVFGITPSCEGGDDE